VSADWSAAVLAEPACWASRASERAGGDGRAARRNWTPGRQPAGRRARGRGCAAGAGCASGRRHEV